MNPFDQNNRKNNVPARDDLQLKILLSMEREEFSQASRLLQTYEDYYFRDLFWYETKIDEYEIHHLCTMADLLALEAHRQGYDSIKLDFYRIRYYYDLQDFKTVLEASANCGQMEDQRLEKICLNMKGISFLMLDDTEKARNCFEDSLLIDEDQLTLFLAALMNAVTGRLKRAEDYLQRICSACEHDNLKKWISAVFGKEVDSDQEVQVLFMENAEKLLDYLIQFTIPFQLQNRQAQQYSVILNGLLRQNPQECLDLISRSIEEAGPSISFYRMAAECYRVLDWQEEYLEMLQKILACPMTLAYPGLLVDLVQKLNALRIIQPGPTRLQELLTGFLVLPKAPVALFLLVASFALEQNCDPVAKVALNEAEKRIQKKQASAEEEALQQQLKAEYFEHIKDHYRAYKERLKGLATQNDPDILRQIAISAFRMEDTQVLVEINERLFPDGLVCALLVYQYGIKNEKESLQKLLERLHTLDDGQCQQLNEVLLLQRALESVKTVSVRLAALAASLSIYLDSKC